jgi:preprotein translocase subunit YajC
MSKLICLIFIISLILISQPCQAVTKCYKDICVGDRVIVISGLYEGNSCRIVDILQVPTPDEEEVQIKDYYKYFVSLKDGTTLELYRDQLTNKKSEGDYELGFKTGAICGSIFGRGFCIELLNKYFVK